MEAYWGGATFTPESLSFCAEILGQAPTAMDVGVGSFGALEGLHKQGRQTANIKTIKVLFGIRALGQR